MSVYKQIFLDLKLALGENIKLVAVSKTKPTEDIKELYDLGQKDFGENYVQELADKYTELPKDIHWHFIGHLQSNKVKYIAPFVELIHGVDSLKLLEEINKQGEKNDRIINCLLQVHIATEETKFGLSEEELLQLLSLINTTQLKFKNVNVCGLMGIASFTDDKQKVRSEFKYLKSLFAKYPQFSMLSMGMSADYKIAIEEGSNMVRIGSLIFGERNYNQ
ncbi:MAG: YggS family pyridoxal phosphate-dependent enzyme [Ginsengibacter sp.]